MRERTDRAVPIRGGGGGLAGAKGRRGGVAAVEVELFVGPVGVVRAGAATRPARRSSSLGSLFVILGPQDLQQLLLDGLPICRLGVEFQIFPIVSDAARVVSQSLGRREGGWGSR
jgi:hypothetical protein